jgi:bifunctional non-homologous end joining protein LigD
MARSSGGKQTLTVEGRQLQLSNLDKVLYPAGRFTKAQVIDYYIRIAPYLLPHLKDRPVTLKRYPNGVTGEHFYEKDAPSFTPEWVQTAAVPRRSGKSDINYILINDLPTLVWSANLANLEIHPFLHRVPEIDTPTLIAFDLDPGEGADLLTCCEVALLLKDVFDRLKLKSFAKVSGSKGSLWGLPVQWCFGIWVSEGRSSVPVYYRLASPDHFVTNGYGDSPYAFAASPNVAFDVPI